MDHCFKEFDVKKLEDMTPAELRAYADEKEQELNKPKLIKTAVIAKNIYILYDERDIWDYIRNVEGNFIDEEQIDKILQNIKDGCKIATAGEECKCVLDYGEEVWYCEENDLEDWDKETAEKWIKDIKKVGDRDRTGEKCDCGGEFKERQFHDDADGILRCSCGNQIKRWE